MKEKRIAVIGLGYVGLPLAVAFGKVHPVVGFDIDKERVAELKAGRDKTLEVSSDELASSRLLEVTADATKLNACNYFIVTVPTPTDNYKRPDLGPLVKASHMVGQALKPGDIVVYESTVYPGCTEEDCVPVLERSSGLKFNVDFFCGYSPERINPGDKEHTVTNILKVTSGSTPEVAEKVDALYRTIITAGTHRASSIRVAEAAKIIENSQRDVNIAFVNELSRIFHLMGIDTAEVLAAAGTKWNFLRFSPGLVGGHCIGVDPYYLTYKAEGLGYHPEVISAGRRINADMGFFCAQRALKLMIKNGLRIESERVLVLGITFKENCPDIRNSRVIDIVTELSDFGCKVEVYDPHADPAGVKHEYGIELVKGPLESQAYGAVILAVAHREFLSFPVRSYLKEGGIVFDIKSVLPPQMVDGRL